MKIQRSVGVSIASAASTSGNADLGAYFPEVYVQIATMNTAASFQIDHSFDGGTTFYPLFHPPINSATVAQNLVNITMTVGSNGGYFQLPVGGQCFRFRCAVTQSNGLFIKVIGVK